MAHGVYTRDLLMGGLGAHKYFNSWSKFKQYLCILLYYIIYSNLLHEFKQSTKSPALIVIYKNLVNMQNFLRSPTISLWPRDNIHGNSDIYDETDHLKKIYMLHSNLSN